MPASFTRSLTALAFATAAAIASRSQITASAATTASSGCHVTPIDPSARPPSSIDPAVRPAGPDLQWFGNRYVWTQLPPYGTFHLAEENGTLSRKFPWWRLRTGELHVGGHPVGARTPHIKARIPTGYGNSGFQSTELYFPSYGCWRIWGHVRGKGISFVLNVVPTNSSTG